MCCALGSWRWLFWALQTRQAGPFHDTDTPAGRALALINDRKPGLRCSAVTGIASRRGAQRGAGWPCALPLSAPVKQRFKFDQALDALNWLRFGLSVEPAEGDCLQVALQLPTGPFGPPDHHIAVEAVPAAGGGAGGSALLQLP